MNKNKQLVSVITQKYILNYLHDNIKEIGTIINKPIGECKGALKEVITLSEDTKALYAYNSIHLNGYSGVAVVNKKGTLISFH